MACLVFDEISNITIAKLLKFDEVFEASSLILLIQDLVQVFKVSFYRQLFTHNPNFMDHCFTLIRLVTQILLHGPLTRYVKLRVRMRRECRERFPRHRR